MTTIARALARGWSSYRRREASRVGRKHDGGFVILPAGHPVQNATKGPGRTWLGNDGSTLVTVHSHVLVSQEEAAFIDKWGVNQVIRAALTAFFDEDES